MTPERARSVAGGIGWLSRQPAAFRDALLGLTLLRQLTAGESFTSLADPPGGITCVVEGCLNVFAAPGPFPMRLVYLARAGWWFGDIATISRAPRPASVVARADSWLLHVPERAVWRLADGHLEGWRRFGELSVGHFDNALFLVACLSTADLRRRVAAVVCWLSGPGFFSEASDELPLTREDVGEIAGLSRNTAGRILADLAREGLIETRYGGLAITDRTGLEAVLRP